MLRGDAPPIVNWGWRATGSWWAGAAPVMTSAFSASLLWLASRALRSAAPKATTTAAAAAYTQVPPLGRDARAWPRPARLFAESRVQRGKRRRSRRLEYSITGRCICRST